MVFFGHPETQEVDLVSLYFSTCSFSSSFETEYFINHKETATLRSRRPTETKRKDKEGKKERKRKLPTESKNGKDPKRKERRAGSNPNSPSRLKRKKERTERPHRSERTCKCTLRIQSSSKKKSREKNPTIHISRHPFGFRMQRTT